ncbi:hypothetical protein AYI69_g11057 [Smittium culicis]|uniref:Uncharacterized protein n=1 Tax=Smittium culicis TaxID=133412 RepID=A0A1R1X1G2_9FUNG|nr:hypothetical protein AYI69_g11057 [Smittium culicis]
MKTQSVLYLAFYLLNTKKCVTASEHSDNCYKVNCKSDPSNIGCIAICYGSDSPNQELVSNATICFVSCEDLKRESSAYASCVNGCVNRYYEKANIPTTTTGQQNKFALSIGPFADAISTSAISENEMKPALNSGSKTPDKGEKFDITRDKDGGKELNIIDSNNIDKAANAILSAKEKVPGFSIPVLPIQVQIIPPPSDLPPDNQKINASAPQKAIESPSRTLNDQVQPSIQIPITTNIPERNILESPEILDFERKLVATSTYVPIPIRPTEPTQPIAPTAGPEPIPPIAPSAGPEPIPPIVPTAGPEPIPPIAPIAGPEPIPPIAPSAGPEPIPPIVPTAGPEPIPPIAPIAGPAPINTSEPMPLTSRVSENDVPKPKQLFETSGTEVKSDTDYDSVEEDSISHIDTPKYIPIPPPSPIPTKTDDFISPKTSTVSTAPGNYDKPSVTSYTSKSLVESPIPGPIDYNDSKTNMSTLEGVSNSNISYDKAKGQAASSTVLELLPTGKMLFDEDKVANEINLGLTTAKVSTPTINKIDSPTFSASSKSDKKNKEMSLSAGDKNYLDDLDLYNMDSDFGMSSNSSDYSESTSDSKSENSISKPEAFTKTAISLVIIMISFAVLY